MTKTLIGFITLIGGISLVMALTLGCGGNMDGWGEGDFDPVTVDSSQFSSTVLKIANKLILQTRPAATDMMIKKLNLELANNAITDVAIKDVEKTILQPLTNGTPDKTCPFLTKSNNTNTTSCRYLVDRAVEQMILVTPILKDTIEQDVDDTYSVDLTDHEISFVKGWAGQAVLSGIDSGSVHALAQLRNTKACDQAPAAKESAYKLGQKQGYALLESTEKKVLPGVPRTICNTDTVAATVFSAAKKQVSAFVGANGICAGYNSADLAVAVDMAQAEDARLKGLNAGMQASYEALRVRLVNTWQCIQPNTGDPLVVDLDDNGVQLSTRRAAFNLAATGEKVRMPRLVGRDALLAVDLNGNGRIDSGAELLGNASSCGSQRCTDGVEALAQHDSNKDGSIDAADPIFARLLLWSDHNGDGASDAGELKTLAAAKIRAIGLDDSLDRAFGDDLGSSLRSLTFKRAGGGAGVVYDVWFNVGLTAAPRDMRTAGVVSTLSQRYANAR